MKAIRFVFQLLLCHSAVVPSSIRAFSSIHYYSKSTTRSIGSATRTTNSRISNTAADAAAPAAAVSTCPLCLSQVVVLPTRRFYYFSNTWFQKTSDTNTNLYATAATDTNAENGMPADDHQDSSEDVEPGTMRVSEIKSELDLRGIDYSDCFDKESLAQKLVQARASGRADPSIIDRFNKQREGPIEIDDDLLQKATGGDGTLPGGMPPDMLKQLMGNPEVLELMNNPKMQEVMKIMMTGGKDAIEIAMIEDKEIYELVTKLNDVMTKAM